MTLSFSPLAWKEYVLWQKLDPRMVKRINTLLADTLRPPYEGIGKPEPLKHQLAGWWSRRIDDEHRLVYRVGNNALLIAQCRYRY